MRLSVSNTPIKTCSPLSLGLLFSLDDEIFGAKSLVCMSLLLPTNIFSQSCRWLMDFSLFYILRSGGFMTMTV